MPELNREQRKTDMKQIQLNGTDIKVSQAALGTALFGTVLPEKECRAVLDTFCEQGGNLVDTAVIYADWEPGEKSRSEKVIGKWMQDRKNRHDMIISTKGGHPNLDTMHLSRLSEKEIFADIEKSLQNLRTDYVDIYFLHRDDQSLPAGEMMETLNKLVKAGKARSVGVSNWCPARIVQAREYCRIHNLEDIISSQIEFGLAMPNPGTFDPTTEYMDAEAFTYYSNTDMNLFSCSAQSGGYFFSRNKYGGPEPNPKFDNPDNRVRFAAVMELCRKYRCSAAGIIVAALCANPAFRTIPILGCMNVQQVETSLEGTSLILEEEEIRMLLQRTKLSM